MKQNNPKQEAASLPFSAVITLQDMNAMSEFIRNFKLKYAGKRSPLVKKKK